MRYYVGLGLISAVTAVILGGLQLAQWWGNVDISISLRALNQQIAPAAVYCPSMYYPNDSIVECGIQGPHSRTVIDMRVTASGIDFADSAIADRLIDDLTKELQ